MGSTSGESLDDLEETNPDKCDSGHTPRIFPGFSSMLSVSLVPVSCLHDRNVPILRYPLPAGRTVPLAATRIYELSFFTGFGVSAIVYWALNRAFPVIGAADTFKEIDVSGYERTARSLRDVEKVDIDTKDGGSDHFARDR